MSACFARCTHSWKPALWMRIIRCWGCQGMTMLAQACEATAKLIRSLWRSSSDTISSRMSSGRRRSRARTLLWMINCLVLSEEANQKNAMARNPDKHMYVLTLWALQPFALLRLCAQHCDYFSRPAQPSASGRAIIYSFHWHGYFYLESTYHLPHKSTNTRAVRPFSPTENLGLPPCNCSTLQCPPYSCWNTVILVESSGIQQNGTGFQWIPQDCRLKLK